MEKIKKIDESIWLKHRNFCQKYILNKINKLIFQENQRNRPRKKVIADYQVIDQAAIEELTEALPDQLLTVSAKFSNQLSTVTGKTKINEIFLKAYKVFTKISNDEWGAYLYLQKLGVTICPYCNENFTYQLLDNERRTKKIFPNITIRADLDHFFPKSQYPLLAVTLYNLVPSCKVCNSSVKGDFEFDFDKKPLNPYEFSLSDQFEFVRKPRKETNRVDVLLGYSTEFDFETKKREENVEIESIDYMLDFFGILDRYNHQHKEYIQRQVRREVIYDEELKERMSLYLEKLDVSPKELDQLELLEINKSALGKLLIDSFGEVRCYRSNNHFKES